MGVHDVLLDAGDLYALLSRRHERMTDKRHSDRDYSEADVLQAMLFKAAEGVPWRIQVSDVFEGELE